MQRKTLPRQWSLGVISMELVFVVLFKKEVARVDQRYPR